MPHTPWPVNEIMTVAGSPTAEMRNSAPSAPAPAAPPAVRLETVSKLYGTFAALRKITLEIETARCYVLLGENGAGKSTLLRVLAGLIQPSYGTVRVFEGIAPGQARGRIGYMSHAPMLYDQMTGQENLAYFAGLYRDRHCLTPAEALTAVGLDPALTRPISQYSQGMRQRASLARVLISQPELLLLDEPFSNMDVASAHQMLDLLHTIRAAGRTIVLTTHQRELAEPLADSLLIMQAGAVSQVLDGPARRSGASA
ncbi:efflux ABC transporter, ATP-binding protein [Acidobacterium capsulatum ATCC 51196]|uniref:Efflux ABC transporter, ATP-binding protein n=2 Tax=Acidobacteriaceae TaxID=204434 RepID=C1F369_ACIC5|nr:efflux ABC transporter, ATP-binding protein [Acidobacterium capsulatum ATCC 51196]